MIARTSKFLAPPSRLAETRSHFGRAPVFHDQHWGLALGMCDGRDFSVMAGCHQTQERSHHIYDGMTNIRVRLWLGDYIERWLKNELNTVSLSLTDQVICGPTYSVQGCEYYANQDEPGYITLVEHDFTRNMTGVHVRFRMNGYRMQAMFDGGKV